LARYQQNLTEFKATGNAALQPAVTVDKTWLDSYVTSLEQRSQAQRTFIETFMRDYQRTNPDLVEMQAKLKEIRTQGPVLQDAYETEMKAKVEEPVDISQYYVKAGLIVGVGALVAVVSFMRPA
jgi:hypothetical protein